MPPGQAKTQISPVSAAPPSLLKGHWRLFYRVSGIFLGVRMIVKEAQIFSYRIGCATKRLQSVGKINQMLEIEIFLI